MIVKAKEISEIQIHVPTALSLRTQVADDPSHYPQV